jgi:NAD(P)-dependent dehydrogenase (short-subunit alcohol dehydrogenase family)
MAETSQTIRRAALVTGASRGIGRAIAIELARTGFDVMINYAANDDAAKQTQADAIVAGGKDAKVRICRADISDADDRARLMSAVELDFGRLDVLVNNAGVASQARVDLLDATEESFDRLLSINLKGPYFLTQAAAKRMLAQKASGEQQNPLIINITSVSAYAASPERGDYCVSKAGLAMMTKLFALRLASAGINVYEVRPGVIATDMTAKVKDKYDQMIAAGLTPIKRWGTAEDVAQAVAAVASGAFSFSTGEVINVDGGFHLRQL